MIGGRGQERRRAHSASPYEAQFGFCRALRVDDRILVSGTGPIEPDGSTTPGDAGAQAARCFAIAVAAIEDLGGTAADVVRTRMYVTDLADQDLVGAAHARVFGDHPPAATMVGTPALVRDDWMVEIEVEAVIGTP
ncbi:MAG: RidA family protein [Sphingomonadaceae bacterium]